MFVPQFDPMATHSSRKDRPAFELPPCLADAFSPEISCGGAKKKCCKKYKKKKGKHCKRCPKIFA